jgi:hypothetical protein
MTFTALNDQCYQIPSSLRSSHLGVYSIKRLCGELPSIYRRPGDSVRTLLQLLYDAGLQQVQGKTSHYDYNTHCSSLIFATTGYKRFGPNPISLVRFFEMMDWFLSKGARFSECWPGSRTTTLHWVSAKAASLTWAGPLRAQYSKKKTRALKRFWRKWCTLLTLHTAHRQVNFRAL